MIKQGTVLTLKYKLFVPHGLTAAWTPGVIEKKQTVTQKHSNKYILKTPEFSV